MNNTLGVSVIQEPYKNVTIQSQVLLRWIQEVVSSVFQLLFIQIGHQQEIFVPVTSDGEARQSIAQQHWRRLGLRPGKQSACRHVVFETKVVSTQDDKSDYSFMVHISQNFFEQTTTKQLVDDALTIQTTRFTDRRQRDTVT